MEAYKACFVSDIVGLDDRRWNEQLWKGLQRAEQQWGIQTQVWESTSSSDYAPYLEEALAAGCDLVATSEAGLGIPQLTGDEYVFEKSADTEIPTVGSLLVGEDQEGGYLRKAVSVTDTGDEIVIETEQGTLSEAVTTGRVSSNVRLFSPEKAQAKQRIAVSGSNQIKSTQSAKADGSPYHRMEWKNQLLTVEEEISSRFEPSYRKGYRRCNTKKFVFPNGTEKPNHIGSQP